MTDTILSAWMALGWQGWFTLAVIAGATLLMLLDRLGPDLVMFSGLCALVVTGVLAPAEALRGFSNPAVATIGVLFVCAAAIKETGALGLVSSLVFGRTRSHRWGLLRLVLPTAALSGFMNNAPIVAMFIPMVRTWARKVGANPSRFFIPLSYASMLGGTCTLIGTSANLVVAGMHAEHGYGDLGMFDITWVGLPMTIVALVYLVLVAPLLIVDRRDPVDVDQEEAREYLAEVEVAADAPMVGRTVEQAGLRSLPGLFLVEIHRHGDSRVIRPVAPESRLQAGDHLVFTGDASSVTDIAQLAGLDPVDSQVPPWRRVFEVVISHRSRLVGLTVRDAEFRRRFGAAILAVHRAGERIEGRIGDIVLRPGDTLMLSAAPGFRKAWQDSTMFYMVSERSEEERPRYRKAPLAMVAIAGMVLIPAFTDVSLLVSGMGALFFMLATRCISGRAARQAVNWSVLVLIGSAIGVATALERSGAAGVLGQSLLAVTEPLGAVGVLGGVWILGAVFASFVSNSAGAALVFPVAMTAAASAGLDTRAVALALALAASAGFCTPIGSNPNLLVYGPGGYRYLDYTRVGLPLVLICLVSALVILPMVFSLGG